MNTKRLKKISKYDSNFCKHVIRTAKYYSLLNTITVTDFIPEILKYHSSSEDVLIHI